MVARVVCEVLVGRVRGMSGGGVVRHIEDNLNQQRCEMKNVPQDKRPKGKKSATGLWYCSVSAGEVEILEHSVLLMGAYCLCTETAIVISAHGFTEREAFRKLSKNS